MKELAADYKKEVASLKSTLENEFMTAFNEKVTNFKLQKETFRAYIKEENEKIAHRERETKRLRANLSSENKAIY